MKLFGNVHFQTPIRATDVPLYSIKERLTTDFILGGIALACIATGVALGGFAGGAWGAAFIGAGAMAIAADLVDNFAFWKGHREAARAAAPTYRAKLAELELTNEPRRAVAVPAPAMAHEITAEDMVALDAAMNRSGSFEKRLAAAETLGPQETSR